MQTPLVADTIFIHLGLLSVQENSATALKDMLRLNDQRITGSKPELVEWVAYGKVLGAIPRCPSCAGEAKPWMATC